jgi:hypothetical protein
MERPMHFTVLGNRSGAIGAPSQMLSEAGHSTVPNAPKIVAAAELSVVVGPGGPVVTLWQRDAAAEPARNLYHRLSESEARRLVDELGAWLTRRDNRSA